MLTHCVIYTGGSCKGNPGPGGYCAVIDGDGERRVVEGRELSATNNKLELMAVLCAVKSCTEPHDITIVTYSSYVIMTKDKFKRLSANENWANRELWFELVNVCRKKGHKLTYQHVKGHAGHELNEFCDQRAKAQATRACHELTHGPWKTASCKSLVKELKLEERS